MGATNDHFVDARFAPELSEGETFVSTSHGVFIGRAQNRTVELCSLGPLHLTAGDQIDFRLEGEKEPSVVQPASLFLRTIFPSRKPVGALSSLEEAALEIGKSATPLHEKPEELLTLLLSKVRYAYEPLVRAMQDTEAGQWAMRYLMPHLSIARMEDIASHGLARCAGMSSLYWHLARAAGFEARLSVNSAPFKNIERKESDYRANDGREGLFRSISLGEEGGEELEHAWVEVDFRKEASSIPWVPVCPATQLVGNSACRLKTFEEANFRGMTPGLVIGVEGIGADLPASVRGTFTRETSFNPGECAATYSVRIVNEDLRVPRITRERREQEDRAIPADDFFGQLRVRIAPAGNIQLCGSENLHILP